MAQALIDPSSEVLIHRHKLCPSSGERENWSDGTVHELVVVDTPYGRLGMLECWEHIHPSMRFPTQAQSESLHIGTWPYTPDFGASNASAFEGTEVNMAAASVYATNSGAYVLVPTVGRAAAFGPDGFEMALVGAGVSYEENPYLIVSVNRGPGGWPSV
ncbi:carbon-nitrogen hydrolase [Aspergillus undulatus]|uniref:carbon-nitrogen hydrolase n=1 Tax=Aspergillus undulatus TaxID=1810928 RepID=UPI003CCD5751